MQFLFLEKLDQLHNGSEKSWLLGQFKKAFENINSNNTYLHSKFKMYKNDFFNTKMVFISYMGVYYIYGLTILLQIKQCMTP